MTSIPATAPTTSRAGILEHLRSAAELVGDVVAVPVLSMDDTTLVRFVSEVEKVGRFVDAARALGAAEVAERSDWNLGSAGLSYSNGHRKPLHFLESLTGAAPAELQRRMRLGKLVRPRTSFLGEILDPEYPEVASAMSAGQIGRDSAALITGNLEEVRRFRPNADDVTVAEHDLVTIATTQPADLVGIAARVWKDVLDPDGVEPREEENRKRRTLTLGREKHGLIPITGLLSPTCAAKLQAAFSEANAPGIVPRFLSVDDSTAATEIRVTEQGDDVEIVRDPRSREQRQHDVLDGLLTAGLRATGTAPGEMRSTADVTAVIHLTDLIEGPVTAALLRSLGLPERFLTELASSNTTTGTPTVDGTVRDLEATSPVEMGYGKGRGYGWIDGIDDALSSDTITQVACGNGFAVTIFDDNGAILWYGRTKRRYSKQQLRALAVRDGGCVICRAPAARCDGHHVDEWKADNGLTDIDNGVLLCPAHHYWIHHSGYRIRMIHGKPHLLAPKHLDPDQTPTPLGTSPLLMTRTLETKRQE